MAEQPKQKKSPGADPAVYNPLLANEDKFYTLVTRIYQQTTGTGNDDACWICSTNNFLPFFFSILLGISGDPYPQIKPHAEHQDPNNPEQKFYCHVLSKLYELKKQDDNYRMPNDGKEFSHFYCNNPKCINPKHIVFEDPRINKSRLYCRLYVNHDNFMCLHEPKCGCFKNDPYALKPPK